MLWGGIVVCKRMNGDAKGPCIGSVSGCPCKLNCKAYTVVSKSIIVIFFSYMTLLTLTYGSRMEKTQEAHCMAEQEGLSFREAEWVVEIELFWMNTPSGTLGPTRVGYLTQDVFTCCITRAERGRMYVPLGPPRQCKRTQFWGRSICLASDRVPHILKGTEGCVPQCVSPK